MTDEEKKAWEKEVGIALEHKHANGIGKGYASNILAADADRDYLIKLVEGK